jgi:hypothetical protein
MHRRVFLLVADRCVTVFRRLSGLCVSLLAMAGDVYRERVVAVAQEKGREVGDVGLGPGTISGRWRTNMDFHRSTDCRQRNTMIANVHLNSLTLKLPDDSTND